MEGNNALDRVDSGKGEYIKMLEKYKSTHEFMRAFIFLKHLYIFTFTTVNTVKCIISFHNFLSSHLNIDT